MSFIMSLFSNDSLFDCFCTFTTADFSSLSVLADFTKMGSSILVGNKQVNEVERDLDAVMLS